MERVNGVIHSVEVISQISIYWMYNTLHGAHYILDYFRVSCGIISCHLNAALEPKTSLLTMMVTQR